MIAPPTTWIGRIGSPRKIAAIATASAGTRNWRAVTRVGPSSFTPWKTMTLANPAASVPEYRMARNTGGPRSARPPDRSADTSWAIPSGAMKTVPATIAHVVVTSGEWRRRILRPEHRVDRPASGGDQRQPVTDKRRREVDTLAGGDDQCHARERHERTDELDRVRRVGADRHRQQRRHHRGRGDEQRRITGRDRLERHRPQDLVAAEADDAEEEDRDDVAARQPDRSLAPAEQDQQRDGRDANSGGT